MENIFFELKQKATKVKPGQSMSMDHPKFTLLKKLTRTSVKGGLKRRDL